MKCIHLFSLGLLIPTVSVSMSRPEQFKRYLCSHSETETCDDTNPTVHINHSLFTDMLATASANTDINQAPLAELQSLVAHNTIATATDDVVLTEKSLFHRLLAYIKWDGMTLESYPEQYPLLIKGNIVNIMLGEHFWHPTRVKAIGSYTRTGSVAGVRLPFKGTDLEE